jgi:hypothetical protein
MQCQHTNTVLACLKIPPPVEYLLYRSWISI